VDPVQLALGFAAGIATAVGVYLVVAARRRRAPVVTVPTPEQRLRRIDATEAYLSAMVGWLFSRAVGNLEPAGQRDPNLAGVAFGQVDVRLLGYETALEFATLCRWLWGEQGTAIDPKQALAREGAFREHLRADLERQRRLAEDGRPAEHLAPEAAAVLDQVIDEVMHYRQDASSDVSRPARPTPV
jgi:hypothetical protein